MAVLWAIKKQQMTATHVRRGLAGKGAPALIDLGVHHHSRLPICSPSKERLLPTLIQSFLEFWVVSTVHAVNRSILSAVDGGGGRY